VPICVSLSSQQSIAIVIDIIALQPAHLPAIEALLDQRFGPARRNRTAYRLRDGATPLAGFSFVAMDGELLVGSLQCWPIRLKSVAGSRQPMILLGPVAVAADREGEGIGSRLMRTSLAALDAADSPPVLLIGDAPFYGRFGFTSASTRQWQLPGPVDHDRLLLRGPMTGLPRIGWVEAATPGTGTAKVA
jgi:predicted N-acetyltransferase YhbS